MQQSASDYFQMADPNDPSSEECSLEARNVVPDSFADWLAQPASTIADSPESEQDILMSLLAESSKQSLLPPGARPSL